MLATASRLSLSSRHRVLTLDSRLSFSPQVKLGLLPANGQQLADAKALLRRRAPLLELPQVMIPPPLFRYPPSLHPPAVSM